MAPKTRRCNIRFRWKVGLVHYGGETCCSGYVLSSLNTHICAHIHTYTYPHTFFFTHIHIHIHIHIHTYTHIRTHTSQRKFSHFHPDTIAVGADSKKGPTRNPTLKISQVVEDIKLIAACDKFHCSIATGDFKTFCEMKSNSQISEQDKAVWALMRVIRFEDNAREELLKYLGFDSASIALAAQQLLSVKKTDDVTPPPPAFVSSVDGIDLDQMSIMTAEDTFNAPPPVIAPPTAVVKEEPIIRRDVSLDSLAPAVKAVSSEMILTAIAGEKFEPMIRNSLVYLFIYFYLKEILLMHKIILGCG